MIRDAAATRARLLESATEEFSAFGLAGARVDRIAQRAGANKQLIYAYFESKEGLFDATISAHLDDLLDAVPFDADDLPGYAVRLFDHGRARPDLARLVRWHQVERPGALDEIEQAACSTERKVTALAKAQRAGTVDATLPAPLLVVAIISLVQGWMETLPADAPPRAVTAHRKGLSAAVAKLTQ